MKKLLLVLSGCSILTLQAAEQTVTLNAVSSAGLGDPVGTVSIQESPYGLVFTPALENLAPGIHGFHVHANGNCLAATVDNKLVPAGAAGGHWDPKRTGVHGFPWGNGHLGDLPALLVSEDGKASQPELAPRIKHLNDIHGLALVVHAGGDNHSDHPQPVGGGGARVACGIIP